MSTATPSPTQPLPIRMRSDLRIQPQTFGGRRYWAIKDPVALRYYHLREEEHFILQMLDGQTSLENIQQRFEKRYVPHQLSLPQLQNFLNLLYQTALVVMETPGQGPKLLDRVEKQRRRQWLGTATNILAIRLPGIDPQRFLDWLYPKCRWIFSPGSLVLGLMLPLAAFLLLIVHLEHLQSRLPHFHEFFSLSNAFWLAIAVAGAKILHELGHALTCRHFDAECHEMGILFLVFTPCLYCNVSDSWMLPNKWHRIAISAAGICVEVVLASLCTFLWWFSEPGLLNTLCLNIMVICSISTILFNANPLLRYDGYYILADWLEIPNLQRQSRNLIRHHLIRWFLGFDVDSSRMLPERLQGLIFAYGVGSFLYRWFLLAAILWFCYHVLVPYRLELLASALAVLLIGGGIFAPAWQVIRFFWKSSRNHQVNWMRFGICGGLVALVLLSAVAVPLPYRLVVPAVIEARDARRIYVSVPGRVTPFVRPGDPVAKGQTLACLDNPQLRVEIAELRERRDHQRLLLRNLEHQEIGDRSAAAQIPTVRKALADTQERLQRRLQDQEHLTLTAPIAGTVLPAPRRIDKPVSGELNTWSGTPLQPQNSGGFLETGTLLCLVGDPRQMEATVFIDQADIEFVQVRQKVSMHLDQLPGSTLSGTITQIAELDVETAPHTLVGEREMSARIDHQGRLRPLSAAYQARVKLDPHDHRLLIDMPGRAKIFCSPQSLLSRLYRFVRRTFHL